VASSRLLNANQGAIWTSMISTLTPSIQLAAKRGGWHWKNGQKLKTCRPFKSDHRDPPRFHTRPTPHAAAPAPSGSPESRRTARDPSRDVAAATAPKQTGCSGQRDRGAQQQATRGGRQPAGSPQAGPSGRFNPGLQPAGATKVPGLGLGRGDEQVE